MVEWLNEHAHTHKESDLFQTSSFSLESYGSELHERLQRIHDQEQQEEHLDKQQTISEQKRDRLLYIHNGLIASDISERYKAQSI